MSKNHVEERCHKASSEISEDSEKKKLNIKDRCHVAYTNHYEDSEEKELREAFKKADIILHDILTKITEMGDAYAKESAEEVFKKLKDLRINLIMRDMLSEL